MFRYLYALHGEPQKDVEDLWLETYFRAWRSRQRFTGDDGEALVWPVHNAQGRYLSVSQRPAELGWLDDGLVGTAQASIKSSA